MVIFILEDRNLVRDLIILSIEVQLQLENPFPENFVLVEHLGSLQSAIEAWLRQVRLPGVDWAGPPSRAVSGGVEGAVHLALAVRGEHSPGGGHGL